QATATSSSAASSQRQRICKPGSTMLSSLSGSAKTSAPAGDPVLPLGLQHRPGALLRTALAGPDLLVLGVVRLVEDDAVVVGQLLACLDVAQRQHVDLVLVAAILGVFLDF